MRFFSYKDPEENTRAQIEKVRAHPWIAEDVAVRGFIFEPQAVTNLEILLVELEYAVADLTYAKAPMTDALQSGDWDARLLNLIAASRAVQIAILASGRKSDLLNRAANAMD